MRFIIATLLLTFSLNANATHHRGHAVERLNGVVSNLTVSVKFAENLYNNPAMSDSDRFHINKYILYTNKYINLTNKAIDQLNDPRIPLDEIRNLLNAPGVPGNMEAVDWGTKVASDIIINLIYDGFPDPFRVKKIISLSNKAAGFAAWANWHIQDGIREEVYLDQVFICSGPGNHCGN